jgi:hypothetical protein
MWRWEDLSVGEEGDQAGNRILRLIKASECRTKGDGNEPRVSERTQIDEAIVRQEIETAHRDEFLPDNGSHIRSPKTSDRQSLPPMPCHPSLVGIVEETKTWRTL